MLQLAYLFLQLKNSNFYTVVIPAIGFSIQSLKSFNNLPIRFLS